MKMLAHILLFVSVSIAVSCNNRPYKVLDKYNGMEEERMVLNHGTPIHTDIFPLTSCIDEMRFGLMRHFSLDDRDHSEIYIKELWWDKGRNYLTSWLVETNETWVVIESLKWRKDIEF